MLRNLDTDHKKEEFVVVLALRIQFSLGSRILLSPLYLDSVTMCSIVTWVILCQVNQALTGCLIHFITSKLIINPFT